MQAVSVEGACVLLPAVACLVIGGFWESACLLGRGICVQSWYWCSCQKEGCTRGCCCVVGFSVCLPWLVRTVGCSGSHFRRVLSGKEVWLGQDSLSDDRDDSRLLIPVGMFFVVIGGWLQ